MLTLNINSQTAFKLNKEIIDKVMDTCVKKLVFVFV